MIRSSAPAARLPQVAAEEPAGLPCPVPPRRFYVLGKRVLDIVLALSLLVLLAPLLALIALAILIDSGRPVLFVQERVGARLRRAGGELRWELCTFRMVKFRTMIRAADAAPHRAFVQAYVAGRIGDLDHGAGGGGVRFKLNGDPRITRVGRLLRRTSLDELPQLFNVVAGTMSIVGPRPVPTYEVEAYEERHMARLHGLPGITGPWQVSGRGNASFEEMVAMDARYLGRQSLLHDLGLILRTIPCVVLGRGAR